MKHKFFTFFIFLAWMSAFLPAQPVQAETLASPLMYAAGNFAWARGVDETGDANVSVEDIATDSNGNVYTTGSFSRTVDFDLGAGVFNLTSAGGDDIYVSKLDSSGNFVWAKSMGGSNYDYAYGIAVDSNGNVYTTGSFYGTADFDPGAGVFNLTGSGSFVSKLDSGGNFVWAKGVNGSDGTAIALDSSGNVYTTGNFQGTVDFDPGAGVFYLTSASAGYYDTFVSKLDSSGNIVWAKSMGGSDYDYGLGVAVDSSGNVYTSGTYLGTADFDPSAGVFYLTSVGQEDIFVSKLDSSGNIVWAKGMGGMSEEYCYDMVIDSSGSVYTTGYFSGTADFDPGTGVFNLTSEGDDDSFVSKLDSSGNFAWAKGMDFDNVGIATDSSGNVYTTGGFGGTTDFDLGAGIFNLTSAGNSDIYVSKLDSGGNFVWAKSMGGDEWGLWLSHRHGLKR